MAQRDNPMQAVFAAGTLANVKAMNPYLTPFSCLSEKRSSRHC